MRLRSWWTPVLGCLLLPVVTLAMLAAQPDPAATSSFTADHSFEKSGLQGSGLEESNPAHSDIDTNANTDAGQTPVQAQGLIVQQDRQQVLAQRLRELQILRQQANAPHHPADGAGRAWLADGPQEVVAGTASRWAFVYEAGPQGVQPGGSIRFHVPMFWKWTPPQITAARMGGYTQVFAYGDELQLGLSVQPRRRTLRIEIQGRALEAGEQLRIVYGAGPAGAQADVFAEQGSAFWFGVDGDGDGHHHLVPDPPRIDTVAGPPTRLELTVPSTAAPGDTLRLTAAVLDRMGNAWNPVQGTLTLQAMEGLELPAPMTLKPEDQGHVSSEFRVTRPGLYRLRARFEMPNSEETNSEEASSEQASSDRGASTVLESLSAPLRVGTDVEPVIWADLQGHSAASDGTGTPEDFFRYARDIAGLDVISLTDHDHWGRPFLDENPQTWNHILNLNVEYHDPGRFVTVPGIEWTNWVYGHRQVLYFGPQTPLVTYLDPATDTPDELWAALAGTKTITVPHHCAGGPIETDWSFEPDPQLEPIAELVSVHGSSEAIDSPRGIYRPIVGHFVRDALDLGYDLGFIGSGDSHDGHPGLSHIASPSGGLVALLTGEKSRDAVYDVLKSRRAYATNGPRILLTSHLTGTVDAATTSYPIGADVPAGDYQLTVQAFGTNTFERVDLIRAGQVVETLPVGGVSELDMTLPIKGLASGEYVYLRLVQQDGGLAWTSPFFVR